jgi:hypothetical protein
MGGISQTENNIQKLYRRSAENLLMFAFVRGARATLHTVTIDKALEMFREDMGISIDDFSISSNRTIFNRMNLELFNLIKK